MGRVIYKSNPKRGGGFAGEVVSDPREGGPLTGTNDMTHKHLFPVVCVCVDVYVIS